MGGLAGQANTEPPHTQNKDLGTIIDKELCVGCRRMAFLVRSAPLAVQLALEEMHAVGTNLAASERGRRVRDSVQGRLTK